MQRYAYNKLMEWKNTPDEKRKPLILEGARQVGKTWLAREFGQREFDSFVEINFEESENLRMVFESDFDINRILLNIQAVSGKKIEPGKTLIFFDEIQHAHRGLLSLKYFKERAPEYHLVAAGSLLGVIDHADDSFPVGKVDFLRVMPFSFEEFLMAMGKEGLVDVLHSLDPVSINASGSQLEYLLRQYYYVGGMPEAVKTFVESSDYKAVRKVQNAILKSYEYDFSKHPPKEIVKRMQLLWNAIPSQLAKENRKFVYSAVRSGARARDFETAIQWLCDAGMAYKVTRATAGELPLDGFVDMDSFKLYVLDVGLHGAMSGLSAQSLVEGDAFYKQYKGALTEQFVLQELRLLEETKIHYWSPDTGIAEVDFVVQVGDKVVPIEVKSEQNLRAKSLRVFLSRYQVPLAVRCSMAPMSLGGAVAELPLYAITLIPSILMGGSKI